jgi:hypothetical protein
VPDIKGFTLQTLLSLLKGENNDASLEKIGTSIWAVSLVAIVILIGSMTTLGRMVNYHMKCNADLSEKALMLQLLEGENIPSEKVEEIIITAVTKRLDMPNLLIPPIYPSFFSRLRRNASE